MVDPKKKRLAVARILNEGSSAETEAQKLGISARQVRKWVEAAKAFIPKAPKPEPEKGPSENVTPPSAGTENKPNQALEEALKAAGEGGAPPKDSPPTAGEIVDARLEAKKFCLETIGNITEAIGSVMVTTRYSPPLLLSDAAVKDLLKLTALEVGVIGANVDTLYPFLVKWMAGPFQLVGGLVFGQILRFVGLDNLAKNRGWVEKAGPAAPPPPPAQFQPVHPPRPAPAATAPEWTPPAEGIKSEDRTEGPFGQVKDAPAVPAAQTGLFAA